MKHNSLVLDFPACGTEIKELIANTASKIMYKKGDTITTPGDNINFIKFIYSGKVRVLMIDSAGYERILYILCDGWFLREAHFVGNLRSKTARHYSIAEEDVVIYCINQETYNILSQNNEFMEVLLKSSAMKRSILVDELYSITFNNSEQRVKELIIASINYNKDLSDSNWYNLKFQYTHLDMGRILGINRVTVSKIINNLCKDRFIRIVNKKIQVNRDKINFS